MRGNVITRPHYRPHWGARKIFAIASLEPGKIRRAFKCDPEDIAALAERRGIAPTPYLARAKWNPSQNE
jgi:predicted DNA-binding protein (MmcQ/YjbR family)